MSNPTLMPGFLQEKDVIVLASDFTHFTTGQDGWTSLVADTTPTAAVGDARGGILALATDATNNNEVMVRSTNELFLPTESRDAFCRGRINLTEAATDDANFFFGFASAAGADLLVDDGAGPRTTGSIFGIYKVDGGTVWRCITRNGSDATDTVSIQANNMSSGVYDELELHIVRLNSTYCVVTFLLNGDYLRDATTWANRIEHRVAYASLTDMHFVAGYCKAGGATSETPNIDWVCAAQTR